MAEAVKKETKNKKEAENNRTLEEMFQELEEITTELEGKDLPLEEAFLKYRKGMEVLKQCNDAIDTVEKELQILEEA